MSDENTVDPQGVVPQPGPLDPGPPPQGDRGGPGGGGYPGPSPPPGPPANPLPVPSGVEFNVNNTELAGYTRGGEPYFYRIDQYGRRWDLNGPDAGYWDENDRWHDVSKQNGVWQDTWTDENGNQRFANQDQDGKWHSMHLGPDGVWVADDSADDPMTWKNYQSAGTDEFGNERFMYQDQNDNWHWEWTDARTGEHHDVVKVNDGTPPHGWRDAQPGEIKGPQPSKSGVDTRLAPEEGEPTEGGDQQGQPPIIDPNAQPVPMPSFPGGGEGEGDQPPPYGQFPMIKDPATGEWVPGTYDPETGELRPLEVGDQQGQPPVLDPNAQPMPMPSPEQFSTTELRLVPPDSPALIPGSPEYDPKAIPLGPDNVTINPDLLDPNAPGATLDPALFDPSAPGPTLDPALLDPTEPGPTLDPNLLDPSAPGETIDPALLDPSAPGPTIDPAQLEHGIAQPSSGVAEPVGVTDYQDFTDPSLTEPGHPEPSTTPGHDADDPSTLG